MRSIAEGTEPQTLPNGRDGDGYLWLIARDDGARRSVRVEISRTAQASSGLPDPIPEIIESKGAAAVRGVAHWTEPPEVITVSTMNVIPFPGSADPESD
jgi:hypothetical protein